jgi:hypothetical protein
MRLTSDTPTNRIAVLAALVLLAASSAQGASVLLGSDQFGSLFGVDVGTAVATPIGLMPGTLATEIEYSLATGTLYAEETNGGAGLHTIDPSTGASLGTVTHPFGALNGLEFVGSVLYGTFITGPGLPSDLVTVDAATGALTTIGATGFGPISGLAFHPGSGLMYGVTAGGALANLVTINLLTGAGTLVAPVCTAAACLDHIGSIEFAADGMLYGGLSQNASSLANWLIQIDRTTGLATPIGDTGFSITGLTDAAIPEPSSLAFCVVGVLAIATVRRCRRQRRAR